MINLKRGFVTIFCTVFLFSIGTNLLAVSQRFPKPNSSSFKPKEIATIDSLLNAYVVTPKFDQEIIQFLKDKTGVK